MLHKHEIYQVIKLEQAIKEKNAQNARKMEEQHIQKADKKIMLELYLDTKNLKT